ncbi:hypothetical protein SLA2020_106950 [Shorea laevis]
MPAHSWVGEEESVEVVADSFEECLAGSDVGSRGDEEAPALESQHWITSDPIEVTPEGAKAKWAKPNSQQPAQAQ